MNKEIRFKAKQKILFEGDSNTYLRMPPAMDQWPWLRISNSHRSWADIFSELFFAWRPELNLRFNNSAVGGSTCRDISARFEAVVDKIRPDWIFITLGGNDAAQKIPPEDFENILRDYVAKISEWNASLVFVLGFRPCANASEDSAKKYKNRLPYYEIEKKLAQEFINVHSVDIGDALFAKSEELYRQYHGHNIYSDGNHLNNLGAIIVAGELVKACGIFDK